MATWTYNTTPFDDIARLRLKIGDTDILPTTDAHFNDEELQEFLTQAGGNITLAAALALGAWIGSLTRDFKSEKIGDYSYTRETIANMNKLKKEYEDEVKEAPIQEISEWNLSGVEDNEEVE